MLASALIAILIFAVPLAFRASLFPARFSFGWDLWIEQKPVVSSSLARQNLKTSREQAIAFLHGHGVPNQSIQPDRETIVDLRKYNWASGKAPPYEASQRLHVEASDYRKFADISNDMVRVHDQHPDWSSSFPPLLSQWLLIVAFIATAGAVVCSAYVLAAAEIGRTYSATLPPNIDGDDTKVLERSKFMTPGFIAAQTVAIGLTALLALCYAQADAFAARAVVTGLVGAEIILLAYWLIRTAGYWSGAFLVRAYHTYWAAVAALAIGSIIALRSV